MIMLLCFLMLSGSIIFVGLEFHKILVQIHEEMVKRNELLNRTRIPDWKRSVITHKGPIATAVEAYE